MAGTYVLCGGDFTCRPDTDSDCPDRGPHTPQPDGYVDRAEWAGRMLRAGAAQRRCPTCGLYAIWTEPTRPLAEPRTPENLRRWGRIGGRQQQLSEKPRF